PSPLLSGLSEAFPPTTQTTLTDRQRSPHQSSTTSCVLRYKYTCPPLLPSLHLGDLSPKPNDHDDPERDFDDCEPAPTGAIDKSQGYCPRRRGAPRLGVFLERRI